MAGLVDECVSQNHSQRNVPVEVFYIENSIVKYPFLFTGAPVHKFGRILSKKSKQITHDQGTTKVYIKHYVAN